MRKSIGIIGYGAFSEFMVPHLVPYFDVFVSSRRKITNLPNSARSATLEQVCQCDIVIISVTVQALEGVLQKIKNQLKPHSLVLDVCSVKVIPVELMNKYLPKTVQILATHPVFGPQSGKNGITGLPIAIYPVRLSSQTLQAVKQFLGRDLELEVIEMTPEQHDKEMAYSLALTHLIARSFKDMDIPKLRLPTQSYKLMLAIKENLSSDSMELFQTIQNYNPYALKVRQDFVKHLEQLENKIEQHKNGL